MTETGVVYRNPLAHVYSRQAYFPSVVQTGNGELVAAFSIGEAFEAANLHSYVARSSDLGETWTLEGELLPRTPDTSDFCRISRLAGEQLVAFVIRHNRSRPDEGLTNPLNMGFVETEQLLTRSDDGGRSWSEPETIAPPLVGPCFEICSPIVALKDGTWLLPTSTWRDWEGNSPNGMRMVAFVSTDQGKSWPRYMDVMADERGERIYWESKMLELPDGRLLAAAWTYDEAAGRDVPIHYTVASRFGAPFAAPRPTGLEGQTIALFLLNDGSVLTVYRRTDVSGLWANLSRLDGDNWVNKAQLPLWGSGRNKLTAHGDQMVENFHALKFGAPHVSRLQDGTLFVAFWAVEDGVSNIRWIKLRAENMTQNAVR